ncbi:putative inorganic carbon transporter subunit DabA [Kineobactrum sediminis]|uniref:putative inorganic carbon transporter subunit DabA n=1 Tax=Kineobactrum sediminis TaxID=1905677 RepID=UPI0019D429C4|nr:putative inorganic carbon transporter subunit DabA [Kineobactrum sediminis]
MQVLHLDGTYFYPHCTDIVHGAIASAVESVAPNWPLDRMIAVNPYWGRIQQPFTEVAAALAQVAGSPMTQPLQAYRQAWEQADIGADDVQQALRENRAQLTLEQVVAELDEPEAALVPLPLLSELGLGYLGKLVQRSLPSGSPFTSADSLGLDANARRVRPTLDSAAAGGVDGQADIAAQVLSAMGLGQQFGRLVLLLGHGSQNRNNPQRAGLDCGACCGQTGEVNARALAGLLNEPAVREKLLAKGIRIPSGTHFLAGLHNTTTDEVLLYDLDELPPSHAPGH